MTMISPLLQNQIKEQRTKNIEHEKIYEDLRKHANDVRPNAPKARLVHENLPQSVVSYFKDTKQDFVNLKDAVKTGKTSDNSLGRFNDLGMKIGGLLIATFLAIHSRSRNDAAMRFVGTGAFFASMKLWPKIFINTPAKLIHGVDPGLKYISAQGDKKDFYLDNQFLPWDITDITDEKEQRRHQKVALQNRTLWMATAGAGVPLMTALLSNKLEPVVADVIAAQSANHVNKHTRTAAQMKEYIESAPSMVRNEAEIKALCEEYAQNPTSPEFAKKLAKLLRINEFKFLNPDWVKPIMEHSTTDMEGAIINLYREQCKMTCSRAALAERLKELTTKVPGNAASMFSGQVKGSEVTSNVLARMLEDNEIKEIIDAVAGGSKEDIITFSYRDLEKALTGQRLRSSLKVWSEKAENGLVHLEHPFEYYHINLNNIMTIEEEAANAGIRIVTDAKKQEFATIDKFKYACRG